MILAAICKVSGRIAFGLKRGKEERGREGRRNKVLSGQIPHKTFFMLFYLFSLSPIILHIPSTKTRVV